MAQGLTKTTVMKTNVCALHGAFNQVSSIQRLVSIFLMYYVGVCFLKISALGSHHEIAPRSDQIDLRGPKWLIHEYALVVLLHSWGAGRLKLALVPFSVVDFVNSRQSFAPIQVYVCGDISFTHKPVDLSLSQCTHF